MKPIPIKYLSCALCTVLLASCAGSSVRTHKMPVSDRATLQLPYYLPKGLVTIDIYESEQQPDMKTVEKVTTDTTETNNVIATNVVVKSTVEKRETEKYEEPRKPTNTNTWKIAISVTHVPDTGSGLHYAVFDNSIFVDSTVSLTSSNGLLRTTRSTSSGKGPQVVEDVASAAAEAVQIATIVQKDDKSGSKTDKKPIHITFNPTDDKELKKAISELNSHNLILSGVTQTLKEGTNDIARGLCFRSMVQFELREKEPEPIGKLIATFQVPDTRPGGTYVVALPRNPSAESKVTLDIQDGLLLGFSIEKSSEVAAWTGILPRIVGKVSEIPKGLFVYQKDVSAANTEAIKAQAELIKAQAELEQLKADREAKTSPVSK